jgi:molecular chaperone GrpE
VNDARKKNKLETSASEHAAAEQPAAPQEGAETLDNAIADGADAEVTELSLEQQFDVMRAERDENYDRMLRARAELENYRRRVQKEYEEFRQYQSLALIRDLLPALDNLTRAVDSAVGPNDADGLIDGVKMVKQQLHDTLARHSVVVIESVGQQFDPNLHEAIRHLPSTEQPAMTVLEEIERGYKLHDRVIRPSKVIVSSGPPETSEPAG